MKEGVRYVLERPPLKEELKPGESYLAEYDLWYQFKCGIEFLAGENNIQPSAAISDARLYQQAVSFTEQDQDESEEGKPSLLV